MHDGSPGVLDASMTWMDALWDNKAALLWSISRKRHMVRETAWYALGLLQRDAPGDVERASVALDAVLTEQYLEPGDAYDGTFRRAPEEDHPPVDAVMWVHFDPNWRQFIGTTLAVISDRFGARFDPGLVARMRGSIQRAVETEEPGRISPTYANIALMKAWLDAWVGRIEDAEDFAREIHKHFAEHGTFLEYNSPTYYGIDLWGLTLWRSSTDELARLGAEMEATLWRDIGRFYHADLRNMCGPYDRAYGIDMTRHATPLGLWIWSAVGAERAPFPDVTQRFDHPHDFCFGPCVTAFDACIPDDARRDLETFTGERLLERTVTTEPLRVATAWLGDDAMMGGWSGHASGIGWLQHQHATIHWRTDAGDIGWVRLMAGVEADASVTRGELVISRRTTTPLEFEVRSDGTFPFVVETNPEEQTVFSIRRSVSG